MIFLAAFFLARAFFGVIFLRDLDPNSWPDVREVQPDTDEFRSQKEHFASSCEPWAHKYDFDLSVAKIYRASEALIELQEPEDTSTVVYNYSVYCIITASDAISCSYCVTL